MSKVQKGDKVKVHYTGKLNDGQVFDSSEGREPLEFTIGNGMLIQGFETGVVGMEVGDTKTVKITPEEGYGERNDELVAVVPRSNIPPDVDVSVGQMLQVQQPNNQTVNVVVTDVSDENVTLDANHPLAGKELTFDIEVVEIA